MSENKMTAADELRALNMGQSSGTKGGTKGGYPVDSKRPLDIAEVLIKERYMVKGCCTLFYYRGIFYKWFGSHYKEMEEIEIRKDIYEFLDKCHDIVKDAPVAPNTKMVNEVLDGMKAHILLSRLIEPPVWLKGFKVAPKGENELDPINLISCSNGLLDLESNILHPHSPLLFNLNALTFAYDAEAPRPERWEQFLKELWEDDEKSIDTLQEIFGYLLSSDTSRQKAFLIIGPPRSGKGTISDVIEGLVGRDNARSLHVASMDKNFALQDLIGKSVAILTDARFTGKVDKTAIIEKLLSITGEDSVSIDRKFKGAWTGKMKIRFVVNANEIPQLMDASGALASRFVALELVNSFLGKEDYSLKEKLRLELPSILNWSVKGWRRLKDRGHFEQPESGADIIEMVQGLGSPVGVFVKEYCEVGESYWIYTNDLFEAWKEWCLDQGKDSAGIKETFGRNLRAALPRVKSKQRKEKGNIRWVYSGIRLRSEVIDSKEAEDWSEGGHTRWDGGRNGLFE